MVLTLDKFHFEISGNAFNDEHPENTKDISFILIVFHFEILGNSFKYEQL